MKPTNLNNKNMNSESKFKIKKVPTEENNQGKYLKNYTKMKTTQFMVVNVKAKIIMSNIFKQRYIEKLHL